MKQRNRRILKRLGIPMKRVTEMAIKDLKWDSETNSAKEVDTTAREYAKQMILHSLNSVGYWDENFGTDGMTKKDVKSIFAHIEKFRTRIEKMLKPK
jgi:hypothetical protein